MYFDAKFKLGDCEVFYKDTPGLDQQVENDWEVLQTLLNILQIWVFFLLLLYTNLFIRHPSTISKLSLLRRHLHSMVQSLLLMAF